MKTIVIGDIHGCYRELDLLVSGLIKEGRYVPEEDRLIFLGDYIDRGDNPRLAVKYVRDLQDMYGDKVIALMGNHEDMLLDYVTLDYVPLYINFLQDGHVIVFNLAKLKHRPETVCKYIKSKLYDGFELAKRQMLNMGDAYIYKLKNNEYKLISKPE